MALAPWMLYGANGYAGRLIAEAAKRDGLAPLLAGRDARRIAALGASLGLETCSFDLAEPAVVARRVGRVAAVLHCAGPFSATSRPLLDGCLRAGVHYLDLTGELAVFEAIHGRADEVRRAGVVALPGVGFDVVPSDCLAAMLQRALPAATGLRLAFTALGAVSPGTMKTIIEGLALGAAVRRGGVIVAAPPTLEAIPFAGGPRQAIAIRWGDVATAYYSTGIPDITVFMEVSPALARLQRVALAAPVRRALRTGPIQSFLKWLVDRTVKGPTAAERAGGEQWLWGEASDAAGRRVAMQLRTPGAYALTTEAALAAVVALLTGALAPGVYTPSLAFGADFVLQLPGVSVSPPAAA
jgi:short subunit dehydrogenase-like uncharacterized protein